MRRFLAITLVMVVLCSTTACSLINTTPTIRSTTVPSTTPVVETSTQSQEVDSEINNSFGNFINGGFAIQKENRIYACDGSGLYMTELGDKWQFGDDKWVPIVANVSNINVVDDYIYYIEHESINNESDGYFSEKTSLCKIRSDGTGKEKLIDGFGGFGETFFTIDNWIFYIDENYCLNRMLLDGSNKTLIADSCSAFSIDNKILYYSSKGFYKIKIDGNNPELLSSEFRLGNDFIVSDEWIYFTDNNNILYRMSTDGENSSKICDDEVWFFNISGDWIYFNNLSDNNCLYKINVDGKNIRKLTDESISDINIVGDWIYYHTYEDSYTVYKVRNDGSENQIVQFNNG